MWLNCDLGEGFGSWSMGMDEAVMPYIDMANIACGFHASDPDTLAEIVQLAVAHRVRIGAHPGYADLVGFGRRHIPHTPTQISNLVTYQAGAMQAFCHRHGVEMEYLKPHGALYNDMMADMTVFEAILEATSRLPGTPALMILALADNDEHRHRAEQLGVRLLFEAFVDRAYDDNGRLLPRSAAGAVLHDQERIRAQFLQLVQRCSVTTASGNTLPLEADTVCVHGDNPAALEVIRALREALT